MKKALPFLFISLAFFACKPRQNDSKAYPKSKGLPSELVVVAEPEVLRSFVADTIKTITECDVPGLGTGENFFRAMTVSTVGYDKIYKLIHSQLMIRLNPKRQRPMVGVAYDVTAKPQIEVVVEAATLEDLGRYLSAKRDYIIQVISDFQLDREAFVKRGHYSKKVADDLLSVSGYTICMPTELIATKKGKDFLWAGTNRNTQDMNFVFYTVPWTGQRVEDVDYLMNLRDSVLKANIPGAKPDQWMTTTRVEGKPVVLSDVRQIAQRRQVEVRGLWELHHGYMGGPFVSLAYIDSTACKIVVSEGFVYSPSSNKRDLLRNLEASLRTLKKVK